MRPSERSSTHAAPAALPRPRDHNHPDSGGVGPGVTNNQNRVRFSTALGYLDPARHRLNLTVRPNCQALRIVFQGQRATGLLVESGGQTFTVEAEQIILSAGAVGSPHLLMLSGVGPAGQLEALGIPVVQDTPGVGRNLKDHPKVYVTWEVGGRFRCPRQPGRRQRRAATDRSRLPPAQRPGDQPGRVGRAAGSGEPSRLTIHGARAKTATPATLR